MWPEQDLRPGRRRHGKALTQAVPASAAVPARTTSPSSSAILRAGPRASSGISRNWRRSETNTGEDCTERRRRPEEIDLRVPRLCAKRRVVSITTPGN